MASLQETLSHLIGDPKWNAFVEIVELEIKASEDKAIRSLLTDEPDKDSARRAKYFREVLELPKNSINKSKMNTKKTPL